MSFEFWILSYKNRVIEIELEWSVKPNRALEIELEWFIWLEEWKNEKIENGERMEKRENRKNFNFPPFCLVGNGKVEGWKKCVYINLLIYPCYKMMSY